MHLTRHKDPESSGRKGSCVVTIRAESAEILIPHWGPSSGMTAPQLMLMLPLGPLLRAFHILPLRRQEIPDVVRHLRESPRVTVFGMYDLAVLIDPEEGPFHLVVDHGVMDRQNGISRLVPVLREHREHRPMIVVVLVDRAPRFLPLNRDLDPLSDQ